MSWAILVEFVASWKWSFTSVHWVLFCYIFLRDTATGIQQNLELLCFQIIWKWSDLSHKSMGWLFFLWASVAQNTNHKPPKDSGSYLCSRCFPHAIWQLSECSDANGARRWCTYRDEAEAMIHVQSETQGNFCTEGTSPVYCQACYNLQLPEQTLGQWNKYLNIGRQQ